MKRLTPFIIAAFLVLTASCRTQTRQLSFAVGGAPSEVDYWEDLIREFTDSTSIEVVFLRQPTDTDQRRQGLIIPLKAQKTDPDVFLMDVVWVAQFAASGWLMPLTDHLGEKDQHVDIFFESIIRGVDTYQGDIVALPVYNDCGLLYYREDLLKKYNFKPPVTWSELVKSAVAIQKSERKTKPQFYGYVWQGAQYEGLICNYVEFVTSYGGSLVDTLGDLRLTSDESKSAVSLMRAMIHEYRISPPNTFTEMKEEEVRLFFENGYALYERNWPYAWALHKRKDSPIKDQMVVTLLPKTEAGSHAAALGGWHIGISRFSDMKKEAERLLDYILSYETQKRLALELGWNPGRRDIYEDETVNEKIPHIQVLKRAFENAAPRPSLPYYTQVSQIMQKHLNAVLAGKTEASSALGKAQEEISNLTRQYHE